MRLKSQIALSALLLAAPTSIQAGEAFCHAGDEPTCTATDLLPTNCENPCRADACAESCDLDEYCDSICEPLWTFRAGAIFLDRSSPTGPPMIVSDPAQATLLSPGDFGFQPATGYDLYARRRLASGRSLEARYFDAGTSSDTVSGALPGSGSLIGGITVTGPNNFSTRYQSRLSSAEVNLVGNRDSWCNPIVGFRYARLNEQVRNGYAIGAFQTLSYDVPVENDLYGGQLGFEGVLYRGERWTFDMWAKAGIYYNRIERTSEVNFFPPGAPPIFTTASSEQATAFVGDLAFNAKYRLTEHLAVRGGYQLLWLAGVAEAGNQGAPVAGDPIIADGHPFYHGATVGAEVTW